MKMKLPIWIMMLFVSYQGIAQISDHIYVSGRNILGPCGDTLLLKGVNYAPYNWGGDPSELRIDQIGRTNANAVRLVWYKDHPDPDVNANYDNLELLDSALSKCIQEDLVPILELHDLTCGNDSAALIALSSWYLSPGILALIDKYNHSLIINIANEALHVSWTGDVAAAKTKFINTYTHIVSALRAADIAIPIMIDGPDCGMSLQHLTDMGAALLENDPAHNLIFSTHAYWWAFSEMDSAVTREMIEEAVAEEIPLVIGEVANLQDDGTPCVYDLDFQPVLHICREFGIGWLAWSWDRDICSERQVTVAGSPDDLTAYGELILHHPDFGIDEDVVAKSAYLIHDGCSTSGVDNHKESSPVHLYPNPAQEYVYIQVRSQVRDWKYSIMDIHGRTVMSGDLPVSERIDVHQLLSGTYFIQVFTAQHWWTKKMTIQR